MNLNVLTEPTLYSRIRLPWPSRGIARERSLFLGLINHRQFPAKVADPFFPFSWQVFPISPEINEKYAQFCHGIAAARQPRVNVSLSQAAAAMNASARWQEVISENLASASIPGFKKQGVSFDAVQAAAIAQSPFTLTRATATTSFRQGELRATGVKTDAAIEGPGFFEIQLSNGTTAYTRDGEFQISSQGQLVTKQGYPVLGESGPIQLDPSNTAPISLSSTGEISQGTDLKGKLKIVNFDHPELLTSASGGYFLAINPNLQPTDVREPSLHQGFLEVANTSPVSEMANLITTMRAFEANQRVMQMQDERMGRAISELGNAG